MFNTVSLASVAAWSLWILAIAIACADLLVARDDVGYFGVIAAAGAATLHVIQAIREQSQRELTAYEMGKGVRRLR